MRNKFLGTGQSGFHPVRKTIVVLSGLRYAFLYDLSVAYKLVISAGILGLCFYLRNWLDALLIVVTTGVMLVGEMFNTTVEALCDLIEPREDQRIKVIKDIAAAAAGIGILVWLVVVVVELGKAWQAS